MLLREVDDCEPQQLRMPKWPAGPRIPLMSPTATASQPTTLVAEPAPTADATRPGKLAGARAFGVMLGGPLLLLAATGAGLVSTLRAVQARRLPRADAAAVLGVAAAYNHWMLPWMRTWGATDAELAMTLPGDETVPAGGVRQTHAVRIDAPANAVWAWVAQIGQDRGGFYSYTWLETSPAAGCATPIASIPNGSGASPERRCCCIRSRA